MGRMKLHPYRTLRPEKEKNWAVTTYTHPPQHTSLPDSLSLYTYSLTLIILHVLFLRAEGDRSLWY